MAGNTITTVTGTIGTTPVLILSNLNGAYITRVIDPTNSHFMAATYDNGATSPVIGSVGQQITPYGNDERHYPPTYGVTTLIGVMLVADALGVPFTIEYGGAL
jgi:hypothetical protein